MPSIWWLLQQTPPTQQTPVEAEVVAAFTSTSPGFLFLWVRFSIEAPLGLRSALFILYLLLDSVTLVITVMLFGLNFYSNEYICTCFQLRLA